MATVYKLHANGGFTVGDTVTRVTAYAYPTSTHADAARRNPEKVAAEMIKDANASARTFAATGPHFATFAEYDRRNWVALEG